MTTHETIRELIALRLYGETDENEGARLVQHLATCAECRAYAAEIEGGLGAVARAPRAAPEMPGDWAARLEEATRAARRPRISPWWTAVAGFAAGVVAAAMAGRGEALIPEPGSHGGTESTWKQFHRETPPPLATTEGQLAMLGSYLRR